jgi:hypothetical protein
MLGDCRFPIVCSAELSRGKEKENEVGNSCRSSVGCFAGLNRGSSNNSRSSVGFSAVLNPDREEDGELGGSRLSVLSFIFCMRTGMRLLSMGAAVFLRTYAVRVNAEPHAPAHVTLRCFSRLWAPAKGCQHHQPRYCCTRSRPRQAEMIGAGMFVAPKRDAACRISALIRNSTWT